MQTPEHTPDPFDQVASTEPQTPLTDQNHPMPLLCLAFGVVLLGTALIDPSRVALLLVPILFLVTAYGAATLLDGATGCFSTLSARAPLLTLAVYLGIGIACLAVIAVASAFSGTYWIAGFLALPLMGYGLLQLVTALARLRALPWTPVQFLGGFTLGLTWLFAWLWATIPPTFFDELSYHLVVPQRALATGSLPPTPWVFFTLMPHASDLLLGWGMAFGGEIGARATHVALWIAGSLAVCGIAEATASPETRTRAPFVAPMVLASSPTLWFLATLPFAGACLTVAVLSAIGLLLLREGERSAWLPFGLALGLAGSVKLTGLYWAAALLAAAFVARWPMKVLTHAGLVACAMVLPWWIRAAFYTGNPIYPMGYRFLGGTPWTDESQARAIGDIAPSILQLGLMDLVRLPWDIIQEPGRFGSGGDVGPVAILAAGVMLLLPGLVRWAKLPAHEQRLGDTVALFGLVAMIGWLATSTVVRFFAPAFALSLAILSGGIVRLKPAARTFLSIFVIGASVTGTVRFIDQHAAAFSSVDVALGREPRAQYLARRLEHYEAARYAQMSVPANARLLFIGETRPYYFFRPAIAPSAYDRHPLRQWVIESPSAHALMTRLRDEGITHVVLNAREYNRLHDKYGVLRFTGAEAQAQDRRLKQLPGTLRMLFEKNGVFLFEVPAPTSQAKVAP